MPDLATLATLPDRELDARLAECMEPHPELRDVDELEFWAVRYPAGSSVPKFSAVQSSSEFSARSLLASVEAEIAKRDLADDYYFAVRRQAIRIPSDNSDRFQVLTAPARVRVAAAVYVMEGAKA